MAWLTPEDLAPFAEISAGKASAMIEDATAKALVAAPCLADLPEDPRLFAALKAILRGAILRWNEAGSGALSSSTASAGQFSITQQADTRQRRSGLFFPSEIEELRSLCPSSGNRSAFTIDAVPPVVGMTNPLYGATVNANVGYEPLGYLSDTPADVSGML